MLNIAVVIPVGPGHRHISHRAGWSVHEQTVYAHPLYVYDDEGRGVGTARRNGTEQAAKLGFDMVCYLDADDVLMPRAIEAMLRTFVAAGAAYVYGDGWNVGKADGPAYYRAAEYDRAIYAKHNIHNVTALMPTATALQGDWTNRHWEDYLFYCSLALQGHCGARAPYPVIAYDLAAGYRRELAFDQGSSYAQGLAADYAAKLAEGATMGCCGYKGPLTAAAVQTLEAAPGVAQPDGTVLLAYSGSNIGPIVYKVNGRKYLGRAGGMVYALPVDVAGLLASGKFYLMPAGPSADETLQIVANLTPERESELATLFDDEPLPFTPDTTPDKPRRGRKARS